MTEPPAAAPTVPVAEIERRFHAFVIDRLVAWSLFALAAAAAWRFLLSESRTAAGIAAIVAVVVLVSVLQALVLGMTGTSLGRAAVGLRVVHHRTGRPLGFRRAMLRVALLGAATLPTFGLGVATLAWTALSDPSGRRRGWHDQVTAGVAVDVRGTSGADAGRPEDDSGEEPRHLVNLTALRLVPAAEPAPVSAPLRPVAPRGSARATPTGPWRVTFDTGESFRVEGLALVGRDPRARAGEPVRHLVPLTSQDLSLSKTHAQLRVSRDGALVVMDRGSTNGSVLVRQGASRALAAGRPATLLEGDRVRFGDREMLVERDA